MGISTPEIDFEHAYQIYLEIIEGLPQQDAQRDRVALDRWHRKASDLRLQEAVLFIGASFSYYAGHIRSFHECAMEWNWTLDSIEMFGAQWYLSQKNGSSIPAFVRLRYGRLVEEGILFKVLRSAANDSTAYINAARSLLYGDLTPEQIRNFRGAWQQLTDDRREAIAIALASDGYIRHSGLAPSEAISKLDLITRFTTMPSAANVRTRWIDFGLGGVRQALWSSFRAVCTKFISEYDSYGDERGQVGALLHALRSAPQAYAPGLQTNLAAAGASMNIDHYTFSSSEEHEWGPDFATLFSYNAPNGMRINRYVLFQAKLIKDGSLRLSCTQIARLIRSSWHSSVYVVWGEGVGPRYVPAPLVEQCIAISYPRRRPATVTIKWPTLETYSGSLEGLLGDRFLSAELGDDPQVENLKSESVARRVAERFGRPRFGILTIDIQVGQLGSDGRSGLFVNEPRNLDELIEG